MKINELGLKIAYGMIISLMLTAGACAPMSEQAGEESASSETGFIIAKSGTYDSADNIALLIKKDTKNKTLTFINRSLNKQYTLNYDGASKLYDKYGGSISMEQVEVGSLVDITFLKSKKLLNTMTISPDAWEYSGVNSFSIDENMGEMTINGSKYRFDSSLMVYAGLKEAELMDISSVDTLKIRGVDRKVCSISIEEGHGYLRLKNYSLFEGGWIEVGSKIIRKVGEDMLITVPTGTYDVTLSKNSVTVVKTATIEQNKETEVDLGDVAYEDVYKSGNIIMVLTPDTAQVYADGKEVDTSVPVQLSYGIHQLIVRAEGYQTLTQYIKVGQENATLEITLEKEITPITPTPGITPIPTDSVQAPKQAQVSPAVNSTDATTVDGYKVTVNSPAGAEVYVDGNYIGIAPISFTKVSGNHEIILRKDGYVTRSYTISTDTSKRDETFSFADLEKSE